MDNIKRKLQEWIYEEELAGRDINIDRLNEKLQDLVKSYNETIITDFNGLTREEMYDMVYHPFSDKCAVRLNRLDKEQYMRLPLLRQALFLLQTLSTADLKLTKLGWLPLKFVAESYRMGAPDDFIENYKSKRINEYDATSVWMSRITLHFLGWIKTRKGMMSLTAKGKKAMMDMDAAANEILLFMLTGVGLHSFDGNSDERIGNFGLAYSVWLLHKFGHEWHTDKFYQEHYRKVFDFTDLYNIYATRVFDRLFYWLGFVEKRRRKQGEPPFRMEYKKTELLSMTFSFETV